MTIVFRPRGPLPESEQHRLRVIATRHSSWRTRFRALARLDDQVFYAIRLQSAHWLDRAMAARLSNNVDLLKEVHDNPKEHEAVREIAGRRYLHLLR